MSLSSHDRLLLGRVLKGVSRSFYLTLAVLPKAVRTQIGLAYLFARAADTIADTGELENEVRVQCLRRFKQQFSNESLSWPNIQKIQAQVIAKQSNPDERRLLEKLEQCFQLYQRVARDDQSQIGQVVSTLIGGMEFDLQQFHHGDGGALRALSDMADFEYYTYAVAGCVGEFWTKMMCAHLPGMRSWDQARMIPLGIRYGKGLQMINILRDLPKDLQHGRCYIPQALLKKYNLSLDLLLKPASAQVFQPLLRQLIQEARDHLDQGWRYTMEIPRLEIRVRLACMWPLLIGIRTLQALSTSSYFLNPETSIKISRRDVYGIVAATGITGGYGPVGTAYWGYWRKRIL